MTSAELLTDAFDRVRDVVHGAVDGLSPDQLAYRLDDDTNSIAWLIWHLTRVQDDHVSDLAGTEQAWTEHGWAERFGLPFDDADTGYGHSSEQVAAARVESADLLTDYHDAVYEQTIAYISTLSDDDLPRIIDQSWDPPVTLGVRLISVIADDLQHAGQAEFIRGILERR
ncbi:mycothiol transferase [Haloechinothrix halophila]|uniref:mycothiol transferase n=1 Tax=Haloechinothrix halophila TaxID=1069073 RepID=UPI000406BBAD|nr:DUF664 domain-containing protein [Haloechinothrix halophila]